MAPAGRASSALGKNPLTKLFKITGFWYYARKVSVRPSSQSLGGFRVFRPQPWGSCWQMKLMTLPACCVVGNALKPVGCLQHAVEAGQVFLDRRGQEVDDPFY